MNMEKFRELAAELLKACKYLIDP